MAGLACVRPWHVFLERDCFLEVKVLDVPEQFSAAFVMGRRGMSSLQWSSWRRAPGGSSSVFRPAACLCRGGSGEKG